MIKPCYYGRKHLFNCADCRKPAKYKATPLGRIAMGRLLKEKHGPIFVCLHCLAKWSPQTRQKYAARQWWFPNHRFAQRFIERTTA